MIRLSEQCRCEPENDRVEYQQLTFATRDRNRIFKYFMILQKDLFPPVMMNKETSDKCKTDLSRAELFKDYFTRIVTDDNYEDFTPGPHHIFGSTEIEFTETEFQNYIKILKENKSRGPDEIPPGLLKKTWNSVSKSVCSKT